MDYRLTMPVKLRHIVPVTIITHNPSGLQVLNHRLIARPRFFLVGAQQLEHRFRVLFMDPPCRFQQLLDSLILHNPHNRYKTDGIFLRIGHRRMLLQVDTGAGDHPGFRLFFQTALLPHERQILLILEKDAARVGYSCPVQKNDQLL